MQSKQFSIRSLLAITMLAAVLLPSAIHYYPTAVRHLFPPVPVVVVPESTNPAVGPYVRKPQVREPLISYPINLTPAPETEIAQD